MLYIILIIATPILMLTTLYQPLKHNLENLETIGETLFIVTYISVTTLLSIVLAPIFRSNANFLLYLSHKKHKENCNTEI